MIKNNFNDTYPYCPTRTFDFTPFLQNLSGVTIYNGLSIDNDCNKHDTSFKVKLNFETPNFTYIYADANKENSKYDLVLHLCPYTCNYFNEKNNTTKFKQMFFPINPYSGIIRTERPINVMYTGHDIDIPIMHYVKNTIYKYTGESAYAAIKERYASKSLQGYYDKLDVLNETKICIVHNILKGVDYIPNYSNYISDPLCNKLLPWHAQKASMLPQLKSRVFEGALMGCILLVYKDEYKIIEDYFEENVDFLYYESEEDLNSKVQMILNNYDSYKHITNNARRKVNEKYLIKNLVDYILECKQELTTSNDTKSSPNHVLES